LNQSHPNNWLHLSRVSQFSIWGYGVFKAERPAWRWMWRRGSKVMLSNLLEEITIKYEQAAWPHRHPMFWSGITASSSTTPIWNKNLKRRKPEQFLPGLEFQSLIQLTMGLPHKSVQLDPHCSHKRMWDFLIKIRNLCPQQTNIPWVGCLYVLPPTAWRSTTAVPFLKPVTDAAAENMSASSKAS
jgi:hypothetical protein